MKSFIALAAAAFVLTTAPIAFTNLQLAWAQNSQQTRMTGCNSQASAQKLSGDARKTFMSDCLSGKTTAATPMTPQERMKACNAQAGAKNLAGDARKSFMSSCLKS